MFWIHGNITGYDVVMCRIFKGQYKQDCNLTSYMRFP